MPPRDTSRDGTISFLWYFALLRRIGGRELFCPRRISFAQLRRVSQDPEQVSVALYLNCVDAQYGENVENHIFKDILDWNTFEDATEPELRNYDYRRSSNAFILAQRQIQILDGMLVKWPESEKARAWRNAWACRLKQMSEKL